MVARVFATDQGSRGALSMLLSASTLLLLHACSLNPQPTPPARGEQAGAPGSNTNSGEATAAGDTAEPANSSSTDGGDPDDSGMPDGLDTDGDGLVDGAPVDEGPESPSKTGAGGGAGAGGQATSGGAAGAASLFH